MEIELERHNYWSIINKSITEPSLTRNSTQTDSEYATTLSEFTYCPALCTRLTASVIRSFYALNTPRTRVHVSYRLGQNSIIRPVLI
jgi:hypothetical protein